MSTKSLKNKLFECKIEDKMGKQKGLQSIIIIFLCTTNESKIGIKIIYYTCVEKFGLIYLD